MGKAKKFTITASTPSPTTLIDNVNNSGTFMCEINESSPQQPYGNSYEFMQINKQQMEHQNENNENSLQAQPYLQHQINSSETNMVMEISKYNNQQLPQPLKGFKQIQQSQNQHHEQRHQHLQPQSPIYQYPNQKQLTKTENSISKDHLIEYNDNKDCRNSEYNRIILFRNVGLTNANNDDPMAEETTNNMTNNSKSTDQKHLCNVMHKNDMLANDHLISKTFYNNHELNDDQQQPNRYIINNYKINSESNSFSNSMNENNLQIGDYQNEDQNIEDNKMIINCNLGYNN